MKEYYIERRRGKSQWNAREQKAQLGCTHTLCAHREES